jgi:hypothetical protein
MNKLLILIIAVFFSGCMAQDNDSKYYKAAYDYLRELPEIQESGMIVSDTTVQIELSTFYEELSTGNAEATLFRLDSLDRTRGLKQSALSEFYNLLSDTTSEYTVFFSEIIDNKLLAEIVKNKGIKNASHERLTTFNKSKVFLFIFNEQKLSKVYSKEIQYE